MNLRFMPELIFREDKGLENTLRVHELLKQISNEKKPT
jgi:ribosome-binding factor A